MLETLITMTTLSSDQWLIGFAIRLVAGRANFGETDVRFLHRSNEVQRLGKCFQSKAVKVTMLFDTSLDNVV